jgi:hypothetical protein
MTSGWKRTCIQLSCKAGFTDGIWILHSYADTKSILSKVPEVNRAEPEEGISTSLKNAWFLSLISASNKSSLFLVNETRSPSNVAQ